ncbi:RNA methyltransferase [Chloroflexia bacterium SDU3-3]|nr:RNA methyltransferase [Chloroflexia bacterium SDU3-3]
MIASTTNPHVKQIRALAAGRRDRREQRLFVIEGVRLVADALGSQASLELALYAPEQLETTEAGAALLARLRALPRCHEASPQALAAAADTVHPQGVVALVRWPQVRRGQGGLALVLDAIQDPGNAGTLLRSAEACGVDMVLCSRGTVDVYSPKVVRSAMGAHFRLCVEQDLGWGEIAERCAGLALYASDAEATQAYHQADMRQPCALIVSNEAQGLSAEAAAMATGMLSIPMRGGAESLNAGVAGSILLFEALRQRSVE